jgi:large subunit ribosomal protein L24
MQRVLKRTAQAQRQVVRRVAKQAKKEKQETRNRHQDVLTAANREIRNNLRDARRARREDWELGPLAPKRDLGFNDYGTFQENLRQDYTNNGVFVARQKVIEQRCAWAGGVKQLSLAPDDRVVILDGPDKGKIDRIKAINAESGTLTLQNRHQVCIGQTKATSNQFY